MNLHFLVLVPVIIVSSCKSVDNSVTCPAPREDTIFEKTSFSGSNGDFVDHCDAGGNLVTYRCTIEEYDSCTPNDEDCVPDGERITGVVEERTVDCAGTCFDGRCISRCPQTGEVIEYEGPLQGGFFEVKNLSVGWIYRCVKPPYECSLPPLGAQQVVKRGQEYHEFCGGGDNARVEFDETETPGALACGLLCVANIP